MLHKQVQDGADDGYATFATIDCIGALQEQKKDYTRIVVLIECGEECGSPDLEYCRKMLKDDIGTVEFSFGQQYLSCLCYQWECVINFQIFLPF